LRSPDAPNTVAPDLTGSGLGALVDLRLPVEDDRTAPPLHERGRLGDRWTVIVSIPLVVAELALLALIWDPAHWSPVPLVAVLAAFLVLGEIDAVRIGRVYVSSTACASLLAMALLGPVPAAALAGAAFVVDWLVFRKPAWAGITNLATGSLSVLAGALFIESAAGDGDGGRFAAVVFLGGVLAAAANLLLLAAVRRLRLGAVFRDDLASSFWPTIPYHLLGITLATAAAQLVASGFPALAAVIPALVVSELLLRSLAAQSKRTEEVMRLTGERATLLEQALTAEVAEREWIAGHVHDDTLQTLAVARQDIEDALEGDRAALTSARGHLDDAVEELRRTLVHVHPGSVAGQGLGPALEAYADQVLRRGGTAWTVEVEPGAGEEHAALLYSLARELLGNVAKHARAGHASLTIARDGDVVRLTVADDGVGMVPGATEAPGHFGLLTARQRVAAAGGRIAVRAHPRRGCRIDVELPAGA
jgi:signal transduction histidine kinase